MASHSLRKAFCLFGLAGLLAVTACNTSPQTREGKSDIRRDADTALAKAQASDASLRDFLGDSAGYAVFPSIGKGALGVGGAYGKGVLYEQDRIVGYCDLSQASIGFQMGGQAYTEVIAFETREAVARFKQGRFRLNAQATAVALKSGAGANAQYAEHVAVFTMDEQGLMYEASIGGQKFSYEAL